MLCDRTEGAELWGNSPGSSASSQVTPLIEFLYPSARPDGVGRALESAVALLAQLTPDGPGGEIRVVDIHVVRRGILPDRLD